MSRRYDDNFKREAVDLYRTSGKPLSRVAAELGVTANTLRSWKRQFFAADGGSEGRSPDGAGGSGEELFEENRRLRKEVEYLKRQREILKKAALILGEERPQTGIS